MVLKCIKKIRQKKNLLPYQSLLTNQQLNNLSKNILLQDEDVIRVGAYETRVAVVGATKKQALFDIKKGDGLFLEKSERAKIW